MSAHMSTREQIVWDVPTRVFHWVLAICVILNLFFLEEGEIFHQWSGYLAVSSVVLRLMWGFFSKPASRLSALPLHPQKLLNFARNRFSNGSGQYPGHNPAAALVTVGIWLCIAGLGTTGWIMSLDAFWGEDGPEELHASFAWALQALIAIHLLGVFLDSVRLRRKTWASMITGQRS